MFSGWTFGLFLAFMNAAAMNICGHIFVWTYVFLEANDNVVTQASSSDCRFLDAQSSMGSWTVGLLPHILPHLLPGNASRVPGEEPRMHSAGFLWRPWHLALPLCYCPVFLILGEFIKTFLLSLHLVFSFFLFPPYLHPPIFNSQVFIMIQCTDYLFFLTLYPLVRSSFCSSTLQYFKTQW